MGTWLLSISAFPLFRRLPSRFSRWRIGWGVRVLSSIVAVICLLHAPGLAAKQKAPSTKTVSGAVTDKAENGISGAAVTIKNLQTGKTMATYANAQGHYSFSDLDPHYDYEIRASFKGVSSETRQVSSFDTRLRLAVNLTIPPPSP